VQVISGPTLRARIDAVNAQYIDGCWRFIMGTTGRFTTRPPWPSPSPSTAPAGSRNNRRLRAHGPDPFHMGMKSLLAFARRLKESGAETRKHMTNFHLRASFPLANLSWSCSGRRFRCEWCGGATSLSASESASPSASATSPASASVKRWATTHTPPMLAAWIGNLVFSAIGGLLFWKVTR